MVNVFYVSTLCSQQYFNGVFAASVVKPQQQAQKFHRLLAIGLAKQSGVQVVALSSFLVPRGVEGCYQPRNGIEDGIRYLYPIRGSIPFVGHAVLLVSSFMGAAQWALKDGGKDRVIMCDVLNLTVSLAARLAGLAFGVKCVGIVTDVPSFMQNYSTKSSTSVGATVGRLYTWLGGALMSWFDAYVFLTPQMADLINRRRYPAIVIEGSVDINMVQQAPDDAIMRERIVVYAGALHAKYGVKLLLDAFRSLSDPSIQLWLYGSGDLDDVMDAYQLMDCRIKFMGVVANNTVVAQQQKATLLVNPRPSTEEFTKYSFPSKTMEYMASGTPVLMTRLPGMPEEYHEYVYLFDDESVEGMARTLEQVLSLPPYELRAKGAAAREFVLREKNNVVQAGRILELISKGVV